jgi:Secretion system C-terminal sorting domain
MLIMKKYLLLIALLIGSKSFAQTVQNGGFETWTNLLFFYEPQGYVTSNYASLLLGSGGLPRANVSRGTDKVSGTYSAKLESYAQNAGDSLGVPGIMITGELDLQNVNIKPGIPISGGRPSELRGFYKYAQGNMPDSGIVSVALTKYDPSIGTLNVIGGGIATLSNKSSFTPFTVDIAYATNDVPDTAIIVISTTSVFGFDTAALTSAPVGTVLYVDDLTFFGATGLQSVDKMIEASLYPNPSKDEINVDFYQANSSEVNIFLMSMDGRVVYEQKQYLAAGKQTIQLNIADLDAGVYQLVVSTVDGRISKTVVR